MINLGAPVEINPNAPVVVVHQHIFMEEEFEEARVALREGINVAINDEELGLKKSIYEKIDSIVEENISIILDPVKECNKKTCPLTAPCTNKSLDVCVEPTIKKLIKKSTSKSIDKTTDLCVYPLADKSVKVAQKSTQKSVEGTRALLDRYVPDFLKFWA
jgi:hypothetical protein